MQRRWLAPLLAVAAIGVVVENIVFFSSNSPLLVASEDGDEEVADDEGASTARAGLPPVGADAIVAHARALPNADYARNPFLTRDEANATAGAGSDRARSGPPSLDGTLVGASRRVAWLDGVAMSEGDVLRGYRLIAIEPDAVVLRSSAREMRVALGVDVRADDAPPAALADDEPSATEWTNGAVSTVEDRR